MHTKQEVISVLDLGSKQIRYVIASTVNGNNISILGVASVPSKGMRKGVIVEIEKVASCISEARQLAEDMAGIQNEFVYVGIGGEGIQASVSQSQIELKNKVVTTKDVDLLLNQVKQKIYASGQSSLHLEPLDYFVDRRNVGDFPTGSCGRLFEGSFQNISISNRFLEDIYKCLELVDLRVEMIFPGAIAVSELVSSAKQQQESYLIDIGSGSSTICFSKDGKLRHLSSIPLGGDMVTRDLATLLRISHSEAENLKIRSGSALSFIIPDNELLEIVPLGHREPRKISSRVVSEIIESRYSEIVVTLLENISQQNLLGTQPMEIVLTGEGPQIKNLSMLVTKLTSSPVKVYGDNYFKSGHYLSTKFEGVTDLVKDAGFLMSLSLLAKGFKHRLQEVSGNGIDGHRYFLEKKAKLVNWIRDYF